MTVGESKQPPPESGAGETRDRRGRHAGIVKERTGAGRPVPDSVPGQPLISVHFSVQTE